MTAMLKTHRQRFIENPSRRNTYTVGDAPNPIQITELSE